MTTTTTPPATPPEATGDGTAVSRVADVTAQLTRHTRVLHAIKALIAREHSDSERAMHTVLFVLDVAGPQRVSALAERLGTDPSTTSRQTAELVKRGLLERLPDPDDGRASLLAPTDAGRDAVTVLRERRNQLIETACADWSDADLATFAALLGRFTDGLERARGELAATLRGAPSPTRATTRPFRPEETA